MQQGPGQFHQRTREDIGDDGVSSLQPVVGIVLAGQFARVRAVIDRRQDAVMIPVRAVAELQGTFRVFVAADDGTVKLRVVELGPQIDNLRIVDSGLEAGEKVAIEGLLRLRNDAKIKPKIVSLESLEPDADTKPEQGG